MPDSTALVRLRALAAQALKTYKTPADAFPHFHRDVAGKRELVRAVVLDFLERAAAADRKPTPSPKHAVVPKAKTPPFERRPQSAKDAARFAAQVTVDALDDVFGIHRINGRAFGDLHWRELGHLLTEQALAAGSIILQSAAETEKALMIHKLAGYAQVPDGDARVRDIVPTKKYKAFIEEARREAPIWVAKGAHFYASALQRGTEPPAIENGRA